MTRHSVEPLLSEAAALLENLACDLDTACELLEQSVIMSDLGLDKIKRGTFLHRQQQTRPGDTARHLAQQLDALAQQQTGLESGADHAAD